MNPDEQELHAMMHKHMFDRYLSLSIDEVRSIITQLEHDFINREENELAYLVLQRMISFVKVHDELVK